MVAAVAEPAVAEDPVRAFVEVAGPASRCYVGEPLRLRLRVGVDRDWFRSHAVQLFRQPLDLPVAVSAPWLSALAGARRLLDPEDIPGRQKLRLVINDEAVAALAAPEVAIGGRIFTVVEVERRFLPTAAGTLLVAAPGLRYSYATRFEEDLFHGRVAKDRRDGSVAGEAHGVTVEPLPEEGVPGGFGGAVGSFVVRASADRELVPVGETLHLTVDVQALGESNLETIPPLRLDDMGGFHVYGVTESRSRGRLVATYEIAPLRADLSEIPSIRFAYFDPAPPGRYAVAASPPLPLKIVPVQPETGVRKRVSPLVAILAAIAMTLLLGWYGSRRRAQSRERERQRGAHARWLTEIGRPDANLAEAFAGYLAAQLGCDVAAVITPDLANRLTAGGLDPPLADATAAALASLVASRYSAGTQTAIDRAALARLADRIEQALRSRGAPT